MDCLLEKKSKISAEKKRKPAGEKFGYSKTGRSTNDTQGLGQRKKAFLKNLDCVCLLGKEDNDMLDFLRETGVDGETSSVEHLNELRKNQKKIVKFLKKKKKKIRPEELSYIESTQFLNLCLRKENPIALSEANEMIGLEAQILDHVPEYILFLEWISQDKEANRKNIIQDKIFGLINELIRKMWKDKADDKEHLYVMTKYKIWEQVQKSLLQKLVNLVDQDLEKMENGKESLIKDLEEKKLQKFNSVKERFCGNEDDGKTIIYLIEEEKYNRGKNIKENFRNIEKGKNIKENFKNIENRKQESFIKIVQKQVVFCEWLYHIMLEISGQKQKQIKKTYLEMQQKLQEQMKWGQIELRQDIIERIEVIQRKLESLEMLQMKQQELQLPEVEEDESIQEDLEMIRTNLLLIEGEQAELIQEELQREEIQQGEGGFGIEKQKEILKKQIQQKLAIQEARKQFNVLQKQMIQLAMSQGNWIQEQSKQLDIQIKLEELEKQEIKLVQLKMHQIDVEEKILKQKRAIERISNSFIKSALNKMQKYYG